MRMPDPDHEAALERLERVIARIEELPDGPEKELATDLLEAVDAAHRALVWHVGERLYTENAPLFERLLKEPVASLLFEMYGLVSSAKKEAAAAAGADGFITLGDLERSIPTKGTA